MKNLQVRGARYPNEISGAATALSTPQQSTPSEFRSDELTPSEFRSDADDTPLHPPMYDNEVDNE